MLGRGYGYLYDLGQYMHPLLRLLRSSNGQARTCGLGRTPACGRSYIPDEGEARGDYIGRQGRTERRRLHYMGQYHKSGKGAEPRNDFGNTDTRLQRAMGEPGAYY